MIKKIHAGAWLLLTIAASFWLFTGSFDGAVMVTFSLIALGLLYGFALRTVVVNTRLTQPPGLNK